MPQSLNRFAYVNGNPLKYTDPSGNEPITIALIALAVIALAAGTYEGYEERNLEAVKQNRELSVTQGVVLGFSDASGLTTFTGGLVGEDLRTGEQLTGWWRVGYAAWGGFEFLSNVVPGARGAIGGVKGAGRAGFGLAKGLGPAAGRLASRTGRLLSSAGDDIGRAGRAVAGFFREGVDDLATRAARLAESIVPRLDNFGGLQPAFATGGRYVDDGLRTASRFGDDAERLVMKSVSRGDDIADDVAHSASGGAKAGRYEFPDQLADGVPYVGQSKNLLKRLLQHVKSGRLVRGTEKIVEVPGGKTAREIAEHRRIQELTAGAPARESTKVSNKIDPIGPARRHLLEE